MEFFTPVLMRVSVSSWTAVTRGNQWVHCSSSKIHKNIDVYITLSHGRREVNI